MRRLDTGCPLDNLPCESNLMQICKHLTVSFETEVRAVTRQLAEEMTAIGYPHLDTFSVRFSVGEAIINALRHAHRWDPTKTVYVTYLVTPQYVLAEVIDEGPGFNPGSVPNPMLRENQGQPLGKGLYFMRLFMTWVRHNGRGNRVTLCKMRSESKPAIFEKDAIRHGSEGA
jgi:serine/threonine-protein kinase RsbW